MVLCFWVYGGSSSQHVMQEHSQQLVMPRLAMVLSAADLSRQHRVLVTGYVHRFLATVTLSASAKVAMA